LILTFATVWVLAQAPAAEVKASPSRDPLLRRAAALFDTLDFENARATYQRALTVRLGSIDEVAEAYLGLGLCDATLGDDATAKEWFLKALAIKPDAQLDAADISPRQRAPFDVARSEARGRPAIRVDHAPPRAFPPGVPLKLSVTVDNDWLELVAGVRVALRREGQAWEELAVQGASPFEVTLPALGVGALEYYAQAIDGRGSPVSLWRSPVAPYQVKVVEPGAAVEEAPAFYRRPWVWAVVGGVVAAGVAASVAASVLQAPEYQVKTQVMPPP
jgi:tetratricopeptide (TPR) repeat protein